MLAAKAGVSWGSASHSGIGDKRGKLVAAFGATGLAAPAHCS